MSDVYSLTITPSRGLIYQPAPSFESRYLGIHFPTAFNGVRTVGGVASLPPGFTTGFNPYFEFSTNTNIVSNGGGSKSSLRMNNSNPTLVTRIGFNTNNINIFNEFTTIQNNLNSPKGRLNIASLRSDGVKFYSMYYITNISISSETHRFFNLTVEYLGGNATSFANNPVAFNAMNIGPLTDLPTFIGTPSQPFGIVGSKDQINSFLQGDFSAQWNWVDFPTTFTIVSNFNPDDLAQFSYTNFNNSPVQLTYSLTKNGVAFNNWTTFLEFKTDQEFVNPLGY